MEKISLVKLQIKTTFDFRKLEKYVRSEGFRSETNKVLGENVSNASKKFIEQGRVTPPLTKPATIERRRRMGVSHNKPLLRTGALMNSLRPVKEGIMGMYYGEYHLKGEGVDKRNFFVFDKAKLAKPLSDLIKKMGKALKK